MKKKEFLTSFFTIMLVTILVTFTGCGVKENTSKSNPIVNENTANEFSIGETTFKFDQDSTFHDLKYKRPEELNPDESQRACYLTYKNEDIYKGNYVFRIIFMYREDTTIEKSMSEEERNNNEKKTINGIDWMVFEEAAQGTKVVIYATEIGNKVYAVYTQSYSNSNVDIKTLSEIFMNGVTK